MAQELQSRMFNSGDGVLQVIFTIPLPPNIASQVNAREPSFDLPSPHHILPSHLLIFQVFIGKLQIGLFMCFLGALQELNPLWPSVTNGFLSNSGPSFLEIIQNNSVSLG